MSSATEPAEPVAVPADASGSTASVEPAGRLAVALAEPVVARRERLALVCALGALVGFSAGLLANGGGFLLVPLFLLALGLTLPEATATSLVVATVLTVPTVITHGLMGDIDWAVAIPFAFGLVPAAVLGARCAPRLPVARMQAVFGVLLVTVGGWFLYRQARVLGLG